MIYILAGVVVIYVIVTLTLTLGFLLIRNNQKYQGNDKVSIIVSARNEEKDLPGCLQSLEALSYPKDKLEIILVNDRSTDQTGQIIHESVKRNPHFSSVTTEDYQGKLEAKARGIFCGIEKASGDWLFITDADGRVPKGWIQNMLAGTNNKIGAISGPLNVPSGKPHGIAEKFAYTYSLPIGYGCSHLFSPFFCIGPNMAIRKKAYDQSGGLENIPFNIAEDVALFRTAKNNGYKTLYKSDKKCLVNVEPVPSFAHVESQLKRWLGGSMDQRWSLKILIFLWLMMLFLTSITLLFGWFIIPTTVMIGFWIARLITDLFVYLGYWYRTNSRNLLPYVPLFLLFNSMIFFYLPISYLISSKVTWKGEGYEVKYS